MAKNYIVWMSRYYHVNHIGVVVGENMSGMKTQYCEHCEEEKPIVQTVGWQPNVCRGCGNDIED